MTELDLVRAAEAALERSRARLDDLNVYPVPDGDTGTNMLLTVRAVREALEAGDERHGSRRAPRRRGNSGVILSQIVRGAVEGFAEDRSVATALRTGSDAAYAAVREPVEGTILTVSRALADEAEAPGVRSCPRALLAARPARRRGGPRDSGPARRAPQGGGRRRGRRRARRDPPRNRGARDRRAAPRSRGDRSRSRPRPSTRRLLATATAPSSSSRETRSTRRRSSETWRRSATPCSSSATRPR